MDNFTISISFPVVVVVVLFSQRRETYGPKFLIAIIRPIYISMIVIIWGFLFFFLERQCR